MNDELKQKLLHYLDVLEEGAKSGGEFIAEQAPETVRQWISYTIISELLSFIFLSAIALAIVAAYCFVWRQSARLVFGGDEFPMWMTRSMGGLVSAIVAGAILTQGAFPHAQRCLLAWLAPNVFIIKELSALVK